MNVVRFVIRSRWGEHKSKMSKSTVTLFRFICQSVLLAYGCFAIEVQHTGHFLKFENRSNSLVKGCFHENINLAVCFHIQPGFIQLTDKRNKPLVKYRKLPNQRFHAQVLDQNFVWYVAVICSCGYFAMLGSSYDIDHQ